MPSGNRFSVYNLFFKRTKSGINTCACGFYVKLCSPTISRFGLSPKSGDKPVGEVSRYPHCVACAYAPLAIANAALAIGPQLVVKM